VGKILRGGELSNHTVIPTTATNNEKSKIYYEKRESLQRFSFEFTALVASVGHQLSNF
jgi:hypothetical protein